MTAVLGVTVAIGLAALVLLFLLVRRSAAAADELSRAERLEVELGRTAEQLRAAERRAEEEARQRTAAAEAADTAGEVLRQARAETEAAERRADESQQRAEQAQRDVEEAERRAANADKRAARVGRRGKKTADAPQQEAESSGTRVADVADALWELERLRLEREWNAIGGLAMPMPAGWDGADGTDLSAAVAVELEVIREVVGTPGRMATPAQPVTADPATAIIVTRLAGELLRALARGGLELNVSIEDDDELAIAVATAAAETADDLSRLATAASRAGGTLDVQPVDEGVRVEVRLPR